MRRPLLEGPEKHPWGDKLWLLRDDVVSQTLADGNHWDPRVFDALLPHLRADCAFIDAGANVGGISLRVAPLVGKVLAFEPNLAMAGCLELNALELELWSVEVCAYGLYSRSVDLMPQRRVGHSPSSWAWVEAEACSGLIAGPLDVKLLDDLRLCAMKVDVQGADLHAMQGCKAVIERDHPVIVFEFEEDLALLHGHRWEDYERQLEGWGYGMERVEGTSADWLAVAR